MAGRLADRLAAARSQGFVGRHAELAVLRDMLAAEHGAGVLYVYGPGGVGKTSLLRKYAELASAAGRRVVWLDGRDAGHTPQTATAALNEASGGGAVAELRRCLLVIDTAEALGPLDRWLRDDVLPRLPDDVIAVIAACDPPPVAWRADPGWQGLLRPVRLANLSPEEASELLRWHRIPQAAHPAAMAVARGHPLGLALMADICRQTGAVPTPGDSQKVLATLAGELVQAVPSGLHRAALEACAQVRVTTEPMLAVLLGMPDVHEVFDWLRGLSVIEHSARGLFPHDLARDALAAELRWRHPEQHLQVRARARAHYRARFARAEPAEQQAILADYAYLHRQSPGLAAMLSTVAPAGAGPAGLLLDVPRPAELPELRRMVARHEGPESARLFDLWCARQPAAVQVVRDGTEMPVGLQMLLALEATTDAERRDDPAAVAAWTYLREQAPARPGERVTLVRFWLDARAYQDISPLQTMLALHLVRYYLTTPGLAYHFFTAADPDAWAPLCAYADLRRLPEADFTVGGRRYGVYGHDWRVTPPLAWLDLLADRETAEEPMSVPAGAPRVPGLSEAAFAEAVRGALRDLGRPDRLAGSPLAATRAAAQRSVTDPGTAGLRGADAGRAVEALIRDGAAVLAGSVRDRRAFRALHHTYLQPAGTQQAAADLLGLPMSTYRRHLAAGVRQLIEVLWRRECAAAGSGRP